MFVALAGSELIQLKLGTGTTAASTPPAPCDAHLLAPTFVQTLVRELAVDAFFWPIMLGSAATLGRPVDRHCDAILDTSRASPGAAYLVWCQCGLLYRVRHLVSSRL